MGSSSTEYPGGAAQLVYDMDSYLRRPVSGQGSVSFFADKSPIHRYWGNGTLSLPGLGPKQESPLHTSA